MRNLNDLQNQKPDSTNLFFDDWVHVFYPNRPRTKDFESMTLYDFVFKYEKAIRKPEDLKRKTRKSMSRSKVKVENTYALFNGEIKNLGFTIIISELYRKY